MQSTLPAFSRPWTILFREPTCGFLQVSSIRFFYVAFFSGIGVHTFFVQVGERGLIYERACVYQSALFTSQNISMQPIWHAARREHLLVHVFFHHVALVEEHGVVICAAEDADVGHALSVKRKSKI